MCLHLCLSVCFHQNLYHISLRASKAGQRTKRKTQNGQKFYVINCNKNKQKRNPINKPAQQETQNPLSRKQINHRDP